MQVSSAGHCRSVQQRAAKINSVCISFVRGCSRSQAAIAWLFTYFEANDIKITDKIATADLVVVATCGFNEHNEEISMKFLRLVNQKRKADSRFVVIGCLAGINESRILDSFDAIVIPPVRMTEFDEIINAKVKLNQIRDSGYVQPYIDKAKRPLKQFKGLAVEVKTFRDFIRKTLQVLGIRRLIISLRHKRRLPKCLEPVINVFSVKVASGCMEKCSYCAIRFAIGHLRSRQMDKILSEFDDGLKRGFKTFNFIADDLGAYGQDTGTNITELLRNLLRRKGKYQLILTDFNLKWFVRYAPELIRLISENSERFILKVPLQSGNERILKLMRRGYTAGEAMESLCTLRKMAPKILMVTHVLIGFPSETEENFEETIDFLKKVRFDRIDAYLYSDRPNTEVRLLPDKVSKQVMWKRATRLREVFDGTSELHV